MEYQITNGTLMAKFSHIGGELISLQKGGVEYLYQGNTPFWAGRAPIMFPICGRLFENKYTYDGNTYEMNLHGFVRKLPLEVASKSGDSITFVYKSNDDSKKIYPFDFEFYIAYSLNADTLTVKLTANNLDKKDLPVAFGGHPGFRVPIEDKGDFTDCYIEFEKPCPAMRIDFSSTCFLTGNDKLYLDEHLKTIPLAHELFDRDAIFLYNTPKTVRLKSKLTQTAIRLDFDEFKYIGLWHAPKTEAPFVCIEPWTSCPSFEGKIDDFSTKKDMQYIKTGEQKSATFSITIEN